MKSEQDKQKAKMFARQRQQELIAQRRFLSGRVMGSEDSTRNSPEPHHNKQAKRKHLSRVIAAAMDEHRTQRADGANGLLTVVERAEIAELRARQRSGPSRRP